MPVADDLRQIADRTVRELDSVHDFYEHSRTVWETFESFVKKGHYVSTVSEATGTAINETGLLALARKYQEDYLSAFTFRQFISTFESFFFAFFHRILLHNPWPYARSRLELEAVLRASDREEVIANVLHKQLNELKYENVRDWFETLNKSVKLGCPSDDEMESVAEVKATRDILEHNGGVVNETYVRKAGRKARYSVGLRIEIDDAYHLSSWRLLKKVVTDVAESAAAKLTGP